ncbi:hypothetical protein GGI15_001257 [Coemansia interrupta]|uniref:Tubulin-folding cofactor D ARM repeats domain-containing protein n=1 Tax=Coemansia interrupta TaxID=1126814 RepID=A0A9W8HQJ9_9FUNG|nr:hypothetical protein GGI15_001257 [Coemansia interrupta]
MAVDAQAPSDDIGSAPTFFKEHREFLELLEQTCQSAGNRSSWSTDSPSSEERSALRSMSCMLDLYQEQPTCLDPYLERIVTQLMAVIQEYVYAYHSHTTQRLEDGNDTVSIGRMSGIFDLLYTLCKVRGYKVIMRFFPHGVVDVEPVFGTLWLHSTQLAKSTWTARYILLIWLSLLAMIPFDIDSIDSGVSSLPALETMAESNETTLIGRWIELGKFYLHRPACEMEGAAVMLSRLLSRKDTAKNLQPDFIEWAVDSIHKATQESQDACARSGGLTVASVLKINGALRVLCHLFAVMDSIDALRPQMASLIELFQSDVFENHSVTQKLVTKATQRLAMLVLPPVSATSIARSHVRKSVGANLASKDQAAQPGMSLVAPDNGSDEHGCEYGVNESAEISEEVEVFIGDTIVRWSAAKGIGRVSERLPLPLAQEIVGATAEILKEQTLIPSDGYPVDVSMTSEFAWHGSLLALAELSRKGLISPQALEDIVPWVVRGLSYEIQRGDYSVGSNVRDAACYVMWAFARMPNPDSRRVFDKMCAQMSTALVSVAVFDREPNVRRAASAAFQEHVGRHSLFPHGISVLQAADFFSVGNMRNAFVVASRKIAEFEEYREPLLRHLCTNTIYHWDARTRELAAAALFELAPLATEYVAESLLAEIVSNTVSPFLAVRHGAIIAAGVIAETLASYLLKDDKLTKMVLSVTGGIPARYLDDFGASLTLSALAAFIGSLSRSGWSIVNNSAQQEYFDFFVRAFTACREADDIVLNFEAFVDAYGISARQHSDMITHRISSDISGVSRENFVLALGALGGRDTFDKLCMLIADGSTIEIRRNASISLGRYCRRNVDESAYSRLALALSVSDEGLRQMLFEGLVVAGSAVPLGKYAVSAVANYIETLPPTSTANDMYQNADAETGSGWSVGGVVAELTRLLLTDRRTSKLINPALIVTDQLIEQGSLYATSPEIWIPLYRAVQRVAFKLRAPQRLMLCLKLYSSLAMVSDEMARMAAASLLAHIGHPLPKIRQVAADHLYTMVCINMSFGAADGADSSDDGESRIAEIDALLTETEWVRDDNKVKGARARLVDLVKAATALPSENTNTT